MAQTAPRPRRSSAAKPASPGTQDRVNAVSPAWEPQRQAEFLVLRYGGGTNLARVLGVSKSQPSRWARGEEVPSAAVAVKMLNLAAVLRSALLLWEPDVAVVWMESPNAHLEHARPIDVVMARGAGDVLGAIDAELAGAPS